MQTISDRLKELQILSGDGIAAIFDRLYPDILDINVDKPSKTMSDLWDRYDNTTPSLNGSVFETLLATIFYLKGIAPLFVQAKITYVPNIDFDFVAYSKEFGPIVLSAKTSLRERYKQADLEGMMLRQVHRKAKSYLITLHEKESIANNKKIQSGLILGLDSIVLATSNEFDRLVCELQNLHFYVPGKIDVLKSTRIIGNTNS